MLLQINLSKMYISNHIKIVKMKPQDNKTEYKKLNRPLSWYGKIKIVIT